MKKKKLAMIMVLSVLLTAILPGAVKQRQSPELLELESGMIL